MSRPLNEKISIDQAKSFVAEARAHLVRLDEIQKTLRDSGFEAHFDDRHRFHCKATL